MPNAKNKRLLVSTVDAWSQQNGSDTMPTLLKGYNPNFVRGMYLRAELSDYCSAKYFYHFFESRLIRSIWNRRVETGEVFSPFDLSNAVSDKDLSEEKQLYSPGMLRFRSFFSILREFVWKFGKWKTPQLNTFLDEFGPEVMVFPIESYIHFNTINSYIVGKYHPRAIGILWDDNFTYKQSHKLLHTIHRYFLRKSVRRLIAQCDTVFAFSPKMKREADAEFGINCQLLSKPMREGAAYHPKSSKWPLRILYTGKLYIGRDEVLAQIAEAIEKFNGNEKYFVLDIYTGTTLKPKMRERFARLTSCRLHNSVPQSEVVNLQLDSDILLFAESLSRKNLTARLSFSTKLTDYFSAGRCIWAVGNEDLGPVSYIKEEDAGVVSTNIEEINEALLTLKKVDIVEEYGKKAFECGLRRHNPCVIRERLRKEIDAEEVYSDDNKHSAIIN